MSAQWALVIVFCISYLVGSVNFSRILSRKGWRKQIEKEGSGNPGTMNMLRTFGIGAALLTLLLEVIKSGLTAWLCGYFLQSYGIRELGFYLSGFALVAGSCFPFFGYQKGGKGVATIFGVYLFSDLWYVAVGLFVVGVVLILITDYGSISSLTFVLFQTIATTIYASVVAFNNSKLVTLLLWVMAVLIFLRHTKNVVALVSHQENKAGFKKGIKKMFKKSSKKVEESSGEIVIDEGSQESASKTEQESTSQSEVVIDEDKTQDDEKK